LAIDKVQQVAKRPYYSDREMEAIEKNLGHGVYSKNVYRCLWCGAGRSTVRLVKCDRCNVVWSCAGGDCFERAWETFHRPQCVPSESILKIPLVDGTDMGKVDQLAFDNYGVFVYEVANQSRVGVVGDGGGGAEEADESDRYFDSVTDEKLVVDGALDHGVLDELLAGAPFLGHVV